MPLFSKISKISKIFGNYGEQTVELEAIVSGHQIFENYRHLRVCAQNYGIFKDFQDFCLGGQNEGQEMLLFSKISKISKIFGNYGGGGRNRFGLRLIRAKAD